MSLNAQAFMTIMEKRVGLTNEDKKMLKSHADWGKSIAGEMADYFYDYLGSDPEMNAILNQKEGRRVRLQETFIEWFHQMFTGIDDWDNSYADRRWRIGQAHVQVGLAPKHIVPAIATVNNQVNKRIKAEGKDESLRDALGRICMIDLAFIEQAYVEACLAAVLRETGWTEGLLRRLMARGAGSL